MWFYDFLQENAKEDGIEKIIVGAIIANENNEILVAKRKNDDFMGGYYEIVGGNAEKDETIYDTLVREVKEETNLDITQVESYVDFFDYTSDSGKKCRQFNFKVNVKNGNIELTEHSSYKWIKLSEIATIEPMSKEVKNSLLIYKFNSI